VSARVQADVELLAEGVMPAEATPFGAMLGEIRRRSGLTQVELARRMAVSQPTISTIERTPSPSLTTIVRFLDACGTHLDIAAVFPNGERLDLGPSISGFAALPTSA
jgi:transcriptional regulator with XRE-family HTH domain